MTGPDAAAGIRSATPGAAIVFHSAEDSEAALLDEIVKAVRRASRGEVLIPVQLSSKPSRASG
jgi:hypothetical protein